MLWHGFAWWHGLRALAEYWDCVEHMFDTLTVNLRLHDISNTQFITYTEITLENFDQMRHGINSQFVRIVSVREGCKIGR